MTEDKSSWDESVEKSAPASGWEDEKSRSPVQDRKEVDEPPNDGTNIYIRGIANGVTEQDLEAEYSKFGKIMKINVLMDPYTKENRGFAFVTMEKAEDAAAAIEGTHGKEIFGKTLLVEEAKRGRARSPTPGQYFGRKTGNHY
jgi:transformer-2 protein